MGHVGEEHGADGIGDLTETLEVPGTRIGCGAADQELRPLLARQLLDPVEIDEMRLAIDIVLDGAIQAAREIDLPPMRQVATERQPEPHDGVAGLEQGEVNGLIGGRARVSLHVGVGGTEQGLGALDRQHFDLVDEFLAFVIPPAGIALGVFVRQAGTRGLENGRRGIVLRGDQTNRFDLTAILLPDQIVNRSVSAAQRGRARHWLSLGRVDRRPVNPTFGIFYRTVRPRGARI